MVYYLVYVSTATRLMDVAELHTVLTSCRTRNATLGVTGVLLYRDGTFMQVLEGDREVVSRVYDQVCRDSRHYDVTLIIDGDTVERQFAGWSMAFRDFTTEPADLPPEFSQFVAGGGPDSYGPDPSTAQRILRSFRSLITASSRL